MSNIQEPPLQSPTPHSNKAGAVRPEIPQHGDNLSKWIPRTDDDHAVLAVRNLVFDMCMQNGGGHGGSALGMAAIGVALWKYTMRYNPKDPEWFDRDRFVLSNGHASVFLYVMLYLVGYEAWSIDELKGYGSAKINGYKTMAHGHPEIDCPGVEVSTGPLGQGIANAVGLAIASKNLAANFNEAEAHVVQSRIYCMTGDGCLMEGVALEAIALAGHLELDNLVLIYDNNQVTCDGPLEWISSEDTNVKMRASGWDVMDVNAGNDVQAIVSALNAARSVSRRPVFVNIRTVIGVSTSTAGMAKAHHGVFDLESIARSKTLAGLPIDSKYITPATVLSFFRENMRNGERLHQEWQAELSNLQKSYPDKAVEYDLRRQGHWGSYSDLFDGIDTTKFKGLATRVVNGLLLRDLWKVCPALCGGGADLVNSSQIKYEEADVLNPSLGFKGRFIRYGIREHAMAAISNGLAAYNPGTFLPITATFFIFYIYAAPGVRMGALSNLPVIHIATHDSIQEGQNGPTHQPVELDSLYRAMPNLSYIRPCDGEELIGAWQHALQSRHNPTMISIARDPVGFVSSTSRSKVTLGAYLIHGDPKAPVTLVSCGSCLHHTVSAAKSLEIQGIQTRVISAPSLDIFDKQDAKYRNSVFPLDGTAIISVEEYVPTVWARYVTASIGMSSFGYSASNESNYTRFGLDTNGIEKRVLLYLKELGGKNARQVGWRQL